MASFRSKIPTLAALRFEPIPTARPLANMRVIRVGDSTVVAQKVDGGVIYTNRVSAGMLYQSTRPYHAEALKAVVRLGALSAEALREHLAAQEAERIARSRYYAATELRNAAEILGVELTPEQQAAVAAAELP